jgi:hypothetical protein
MDGYGRPGCLLSRVAEPWPRVLPAGLPVLDASHQPWRRAFARAGRVPRTTGGRSSGRCSRRKSMNYPALFGAGVVTDVRWPGRCRPPAGTVSTNCHPGTGTQVSSIYRDRTGTGGEIAIGQ